MKRQMFERLHVIIAVIITIIGSSGLSQEWTLECIDCPPRLSMGYADRTICLDSAGNPHVVFGGDHLYYAWFDGEWELEVVDDSPSTGVEPSLVLDGNGYPHISYLSFVGNGQLRYAYKSPGGWEIAIPDDGAGTGAGRYSTIAVDSSDEPHISYMGGNHAIRHAHRESGVWSVETLETNLGTYGGENSIDIDQNDYAHIAYYDDTNDRLRYAYEDMAGWHLETPDATYGVGSGVSLVLDSSDYPHISHFHWAGSYDLRYSYKDGTGWHHEDADTQGITGMYTSIALDTSGYPHISYTRDTPSIMLRYAYKDAMGWHSHDVGPQPSGSSTSIALDGADYPHIAFGEDGYSVDDRYVYAFFDGGGWNFHTLVQEAWVGQYSSLVVEDDGTAHVAYEGYDYKTQYAHREPETGEWVSEIVETGDEIAWHTELALDPAGRPHMTYYDAWNYFLRYAFYNGSAWQTEIADTAVQANGTIAVDDSSVPHVCYVERDTYFLRYGYRSGSVWTFETMPGITYSRPSMVLDSNGKAHMCFVNSSSELKYAKRDVSGWFVETVDGSGSAANYDQPSIDLDSAGYPHIGYYLTIGRDLRCAYKDGSGWHFEYVDTLGIVGNNPSLKIDVAGYPHISYRDVGNEDLRYAFKNETGWHLSLVDSAGYVGENSSLFLFNKEFPHISYFDLSNWDLRYAFLPAPLEINLHIFNLGGGNLELVWNPIDAFEYWIYGAPENPFFEPGFGAGYLHRIDVVPQSTTNWMGALGVGDETENWSFMVIGVEIDESEITRSNRVGEEDYLGDIP